MKRSDKVAVLFPKGFFQLTRRQWNYRRCIHKMSSPAPESWVQTDSTSRKGQ